MKNVMWKGELDKVIRFDSLMASGTFAIGPLEGLRGEVLIFDGVPFISKVREDASLNVTKEPESGAPFLVYSLVQDWKQAEIPDSISTVPELENYLTQITSDKTKEPFPFRLAGTVEFADFHVQNLPEGSKVRSPEEAHRGQVNYFSRDLSVDLVGFYSQNHQGIFTHHDTYVHIHLLSTDRQQMGHVDNIRWEGGAMALYLPAALVN